MSATQVLDILEAHFSIPQGRGRRKRPSPWAFLRELRIGTGRVGRNKQQRETRPHTIKQRIDAWTYNTWPSQREAISFEVKTSRQDFLNEIRRPEKRLAAQSVSNRFYFVSCEGVVRSVMEIPEDCGWMEIVDGLLILRKEAPWRELPTIPLYFFTSIVRRAGRVSTSVAI